MKKITTYNPDGTSNGWLVPLWHTDSSIPVDQVYLTVISPGQSKGPHLHLHRSGMFTCIRGSVDIITRCPDGNYRHSLSGPDTDFRTVLVPKGFACQLVNLDPSNESYILNMPSPPWRADFPDENPVDDWNPS
jgi:dTDP-4-dehydrorhamnose 3,5-epimerase-like enzyme